MPRPTLRVVWPAVRPRAVTSDGGFGCWAAAEEGSPLMAWPATRPATRIPIPSTRPMVCGLTSSDSSNGPALLLRPQIEW